MRRGNDVMGGIARRGNDVMGGIARRFTTGAGLGSIEWENDGGAV